MNFTFFVSTYWSFVQSTQFEWMAEWMSYSQGCQVDAAVEDIIVMLITFGVPFNWFVELFNFCVARVDKTVLVDSGAVKRSKKY